MKSSDWNENYTTLIDMIEKKAKGKHLKDFYITMNNEVINSTNKFKQAMMAKPNQSEFHIYVKVCIFFLVW